MQKFHSRPTSEPNISTSQLSLECCTVDHSNNIDGGSRTSVITRTLKGMSLVPSNLKPCMTCQLCLQYRFRYNHLTRLDLTTSSGSVDLCLSLRSFTVSPTSIRQIEHGQAILFESLSVTPLTWVPMLMNEQSTQ